MRALLDINVLLALLDRDHVVHESGRQWFKREVRHGWAFCAVTQNGVIRILSQPSYPSPVSTGRRPAFWPPRHRPRTTITGAATSLFDETIDHSRIHGPRQLTDV